MMVGDSPAFVFTAITKTATQTMLRVLREHYGGYLLADANMHSMEVPAWAQRRFTFTVCRNPYDRAVSLWWSTTQTSDERRDDRYGFRRLCPDPDSFPAFAEWLAADAPDHELTRTQARHVEGVRLDALLRFESLAQDFATLPFYCGEPAEWPRENRTIDERQPWTHYMTRAAVQSVNRWCPDDFGRFGYPRL